MIKVIVEVRGGVVVAVSASEEVRVSVIDWDAQDEEEERENKRLQRQAAEMPYSAEV